MLKILSILSVLLSAFLVFQIQPILGKLILPQYGGSASVWMASMMFFQTILFGGYCYALLLNRLNRIQKQLAVHLVMLLISVISLSDLTASGELTPDFVNPVLGIFILLWQKAGIPYFLLAGSGVLVQRWLLLLDNRYYGFDKHWFAWSNFGALAALCSYPFGFEPLLSLSQQITLWSSLFVLYLAVMTVLLIICLIRSRGCAAAVHSSAKGWSVYWVIYPLLGVMVLMSTTYMMTQNVTPIPFLWLAPLVLYLLSFICCYARLSLYNRQYIVPLMVFCAAAGILMFFTGSLFGLYWQVSMYLLILFVTLLVCHGELALLAPESAQNNSLYYWCISLGGCLGGVLVTIIAPAMFNQILEYPMALFAVLGVLLWQQYSEQKGKASVKQSSIWLASSAVILGGFVYINTLFLHQEVIAYRNFYGVVSVRDI